MKWISVKERKPNPGYYRDKKIIVYGRPVHTSEEEWPNEVFMARMDRDRPHWYDITEDRESNFGRLQFEYWMPLPDKPEING